MYSELCSDSIPMGTVEGTTGTATVGGCFCATRSALGLTWVNHEKDLV